MSLQAPWFYSGLGARLREARVKAGLSQEALADRASLSRTSISNIESGRQRVLAHMVYVLAAAVGISPQELLPDSKTPASASEIDRRLGRTTKDEEEQWVREVIGAATEEGPHGQA